MTFRSYGASFYLSALALSSFSLTKTIYSPTPLLLMAKLSDSSNLSRGLAQVLFWCRRGESNPRPRVYETLALPLSYAGEKQPFILRRAFQLSQALMLSGSRLQLTGFAIVMA